MSEIGVQVRRKGHAPFRSLGTDRSKVETLELDRGARSITITQDAQPLLTFHLRQDGSYTLTHYQPFEQAMPTLVHCYPHVRNATVRKKAVPKVKRESPVRYKRTRVTVEEHGTYFRAFDSEDGTREAVGPSSDVALGRWLRAYGRNFTLVTKPRNEVAPCG